MFWSWDPSKAGLNEKLSFFYTRVRRLILTVKCAKTLIAPRDLSPTCSSESLYDTTAEVSALKLSKLAILFMNTFKP